MSDPVATDSQNLAEKGFAAARFNLAQTYKQVTILKFNKSKKTAFYWFETQQPPVVIRCHRHRINFGANNEQITNFFPSATGKLQAA